MHLNIFKTLFAKTIIKLQLFGIDDAIIGAVGGSLVSGLFGSKQASDNRDFQAQMSNTAYTRAVADMKNAGINPILAGKFGGASTPQGAMATMQAPDFVGAISTAKGMEKTDAEIGKIEQEVKNLKTTRHLTASHISQVSASIEKMYTDLQNVQAKTQGQLNINDVSGIIAKFIQSSDAQGAAGSAGSVGRQILNELINSSGQTIGTKLFQLKQLLENGMSRDQLKQILGVQ